MEVMAVEKLPFITGIFCDTNWIRCTFPQCTPSTVILHVTNIQTIATNKQRSILAFLYISPWGTDMNLF